MRRMSRKLYKRRNQIYTIGIISVLLLPACADRVAESIPFAIGLFTYLIFMAIALTLIDWYEATK